MANSIDSYCWEETRKVLTFSEMQVPSLCSFGHYQSNRAIVPLVHHHHENRMELVFVVRGSQTYTVEGQEYPLVGSDILITFPGEHHGTGVKPQDICEFYWMQLDMRPQESFLGLAAPYGERLLQRLRGMDSRCFSCGAHVQKGFQASFHAFAKRETLEQEHGRAMVVELLYEILRCQQESVRVRPPEIQRALRYMQAHLYEEMTLEEIARDCGLSVSRMKTRFKETMGMGPRNFINQCKVERAKQMLLEEEDITRVALELGFSSSSYFTVVFKRFTTVTPTQYQQKAKLGEVSGI